MAGTDRRSNRHLIDEIRDSGQRFGFFQAVRLMALASRDGAPAPAIPRGLRFGTPLSLGFPSSDILEVTRRDDRTAIARESLGESPCDTANPGESALHMTVGFMGLTGPSGVLPTAYTELLIERHNFHRDTAAHRFLDLFAHRAVSLFYEAWRKHRFYLAYEAGERDGFTRNVLDVVGVGLATLRSRLGSGKSGVPDAFLAHFAGLLSQKPIPAANIAALVRGYFDVPVEVEQFVGQWIEVPEQEQTCLGTRVVPLGDGAFAGGRIWDRQNKICVRLGPLSESEFEDFLPGRPGALALTELIRFCIGQSLACDLELALDKKSVRPMQLGGIGDTGARLGYTTWLQTLGMHEHPGDARFSLLA